MGLVTSLEYSKVDIPQMVTFLLLPYSTRIRNTRLFMRWLASPIEHVLTFLIIFGAYMDILFIIKLKIIVVIKWFS